MKVPGIEVWTKGRRLEVTRSELEDARRQVVAGNRENLELRRELDAQEKALADVRYTLMEIERDNGMQRERTARLRGMVGW